jgi:hypothetical protein
MRTIAAVLLFAAAAISTASAQMPPALPAPAKSAPATTAPAAPAAPAQDNSFAMDHGRAADAGAAAAAAAAKAQAAPGAPEAPKQSTTFIINGDSVIRALPPLTPEQAKAEAQGREAWQARCRPTVIEDREGLRRVRYAEPDCDLSRFNTAGQ